MNNCDEIFVGERVYVRVNVKDLDGELVPDSQVSNIKFVWVKPDLTELVQQKADVDVELLSLGKYQTSFKVDQSGNWIVGIETTGTTESVSKVEFLVNEKSWQS